MLIVNAIVLIILVSLYFISCRYPGDWLKNLDKGEHKLHFLYPMADFLLAKLQLKRYLYSRARVEDTMKALYVTNKPELLQRLYWCNKISTVYAILAVCSVLSLCVQLGAGENSLLREGKYLTRPDHGAGSTQVTLDVSLTEDAGGQSKGEPAGQREVTVHVSEREYSREELPEVFSEAEKYLEREVLGDNEAPDKITQALNFCKTVPGTGITVEWRPSDTAVVRSDGTIANTQIEQIAEVSVTVILSYRQQKHETVMRFQILPKKYTKEELLDRKLEAAIKEAAEKTAEQELLALPVSIEDYLLSWSTKKDPVSLNLILLGLLLCILAWFMGDKELDKRMEKRKEQMLFDYPEIINKFTLLVNAGMTVKQTWEKIAEEYHTRYGKLSVNKRYAYEEMLTTVHELRLGLSESTAYEQYGRRIGLIPYIKFCSLISQNLRKGNKGFTELLRKEAIDAFEVRKVMAKRLGEEAGTKLLFPMLLMLIIVFCIILVPSFLSFQIG